MKFVYLYLPVLVCLWGCSSASVNGTSISNDKRTLSLGTLSALVIGTSSREDIVASIGNPDKRIIIPESDGKLETWQFFDGEIKVTPRASLVIDIQSGKITAMTWQVRSGEPEEKLEVAKNKIGPGTFQVKESEWINSHAASDELIYTNKKAGGSVIFSKTPKRVEFITWHAKGQLARNTAESND